MTLTSILPTLRATIPDPIALDKWPEWTTPTTTDVIVSGISLLRLVDVCETPCVHTAAAVIPGTHGLPSDREQASVIVTRVTAIKGPGVLVLDADLTAVPAYFDEARMIGRASTRRTRPFQIAGTDVMLPDDLTVGDLIVVPCLGAIGRRQTRTEVAS